MYVYKLIFNLILLRKENKKFTLHLPLLLLLLPLLLLLLLPLLLAPSACVREERSLE